MSQKSKFGWNWENKSAFCMKKWVQCNVPCNIKSPWKCCLHLNCIRLLVLLSACPFTLWVWLHLTHFCKIWFWGLLWKSIQVPHLVKIGQKQYVLLLLVELNFLGNARFQWNGIGLLGQLRRYEHHADMLWCYVICALHIFFMCTNNSYILI